MNAEFLTFFEQTDLFEMYVVVSQSSTGEIAFSFCILRRRESVRVRFQVNNFDSLAD